jgi:hypothetical protein
MLLILEELAGCTEERGAFFGALLNRATAPRKRAQADALSPRTSSIAYSSCRDVNGFVM